MKAFRGFKRFDDDKKERRLTSSRRRKQIPDHSALPILNFEDLGLSPVNNTKSSGRWDILKAEDDDVDIFEMNGTKDPVDFQAATKDKILAEAHKNRPDEIPTSVHVRGDVPKQQPPQYPEPTVVSDENVAEVFDPFQLDEQDEAKPNEQSTFPEKKPSEHHVFSLEDAADFDFGNDEWKEFRLDNDQDVQLFGSKQNEVASRTDQQPKQDDTPTYDEDEDEDNEEGLIQSKHIRGARQSFLSETNADGFSISSFPMRIKPIEFLKKNRTADAADDFADDIFLKIDQSAHMRCPNPKRESTSETIQDDTSSHSTSTIPQIQQVETGIEVIDAETVASLAKQLSSESSRKDSGNGKAENTVVELLSPAPEQMDVRTPKDQQSPNKRMSSLLQAEKLASVNESTELSKRASTSKETIDSDENKSKDDILEALAKFADPLLNPGSVSLKDDNPVKLAAEKRGISLSEGKHNDRHTAEGSIKVPLSVEIKHKKSKVAEAGKEINAKHSIHLDNDNAGRQHEHALRPCDSSLLDSVTEVSDFQSMSTQSSVNPRKHLQTIDTKTINSGGSVSALSFLGRPLSTNAEDTGDESHPNISIPRGPTRRTESDFASIEEEPEIQKPERKKRYKPLGASANEIKGINAFLAIAGPDFDGARLSISEREGLFKKAFKAGLTESFINRMLDQSAGILLWEQQSAISEDHSELTEEMSTRTYSPSTSTRQTTRRGKGNCDDSTKVTMMSSYSEDNMTYDEDGFTRKTPKEDNFSCLKNIFWMESSAVVGDDMTENLMAVLSQDSESIYSRRRRTMR